MRATCLPLPAGSGSRTSVTPSAVTRCTQAWSRGGDVGDAADEVDGAQVAGRVDHPQRVGGQVEDGRPRARCRSRSRSGRQVAEPADTSRCPGRCRRRARPGGRPGGRRAETLDVGAVVVVEGVRRDHGRGDRRRTRRTPQGHRAGSARPCAGSTGRASASGAGPRTSWRAPPGRGPRRARARCRRRSAGSGRGPRRSPDRSDRRRAGRRRPAGRPGAGASPTRPTGTGARSGPTTTTRTSQPARPPSRRARRW